MEKVPKIGTFWWLRGDFRPLHRRTLPAFAGQGSAVIPVISSKYNEAR